MINSFVVSLDFTAIINILQQSIKIMHEKMLKAINLYRLHNDAAERNTSLNRRSNKPPITE